MADHCVITGKHLGLADVELHHPVRDGRPPIPLSKNGHDRIESTSRDSTDPIESALREIKRQGNRSWVMPCLPPVSWKAKLLCRSPSRAFCLFDLLGRGDAAFASFVCRLAFLASLFASLFVLLRFLSLLLSFLRI